MILENFSMPFCNIRSNKGCKISVCSGVCTIRGDINKKILGDPAADHRIISHDQSRNQEGKFPKEVPFRMQGTEGL